MNGSLDRPRSSAGVGQADENDCTSERTCQRVARVGAAVRQELLIRESKSHFIDGLPRPTSGLYPEQLATQRAGGQDRRSPSAGGRSQ